MRVLIFSTAYYPLVGGAEVAIKEVTDRSPEIIFDLITARFDRSSLCEERIGNVNVYRVGFGIPFFDKWWLAKWGGFKAFFLNRKHKYDISWSVMASWGGLAAAWFNVIHPQVPLAVTLQEGDEISGRKLGFVALGWRFILSRARSVSVISNYLGEQARKFGYDGKIELIPNGVDIEKFEGRMNQFERADIRKKLGVSETDVLLVTSSRLTQKNGVNDLIESLNFLPPHVKLLIAGAGELEKELIQLCENLELGKRVIFLGFVSHDSLPEILKASDIFIRPSLSEGLGNSFLEAMAAGVPVIATRVGGIPDFLEPKITGLFCEVGNPESIAQKVMEYLNDQLLTREVIRNASKMVKERYVWENITAAYEALWKSCLKK